MAPAAKSCEKLRALTSTNMRDLQIVGGIKKLNNQNYSTWSTCMMPEKTTTVKTQPAEEMKEDLCKWKIKTGKAMFALKTMIEEDMLEHI